MRVRACPFPVLRALPASPADRPPSGRARFGLRLAAVSLVALVSLSGCARPLVPVQLEPLLFTHEAAPIEGKIGLCVSRALRMRQWNVREHPIRINLGERAALNVERMAKAAFREVVVSFDAECDQPTNYPILDVRILAANRSLSSMLAGEQSTSVTLTLAIRDGSGSEIWTTTTRGDIESTVGSPLARRESAAEDFGRAMAIALEEGFRRIVLSGPIRAAVKPS